MIARHTVAACFAAALVLVGLSACGGDTPPGGASAPIDPQSTPAAVADAIFAAAKSGQYAGLPGLIDTKDADGDAKQIGAVGSAKPNEQKEFQTFFAKGTISGEVKIDGDKAAVPILFGPEGKKPETFNMIRRDGKWYLQSF